MESFGFCLLAYHDRQLRIDECFNYFTENGWAKEVKAEGRQYFRTPSMMPSRPIANALNGRVKDGEGTPGTTYYPRPM